MIPSLNLKIAVGIIVFCLFNYFYLIPAQVIDKGSSPVYPYLVNSMLTLFSLGYLMESYFAMRRNSREAGSEHTAEDSLGRGENCDHEEPAASAKAKALRVALLFVLMALWYWLLEDLGFMLSAFIFLVLSSIVYGAKSPVKIGLLSVAMPLIFHIIFRSLGSALPEGPVEELITSILYN